MGVMDSLGSLNPVKRLAGKGGEANADTGTYYTTPWAWRDDDGVYVGHNKEVWLYRVLDVAPLVWEDANTQLEMGSPLASMLYELADTSKDLGVGIRSLSRNREVHLLAITWEESARPPETAPPELRQYLEATLDFVVPRKALVIGVRLWSSLAPAQPLGKKSLLSQLRDRATSALNEEVPDLEAYATDRRVVSEIFRRQGASRPPSREVRAHMESWYNNGRGADATVLETKDMLYVDTTDRIEMAAVMSFDRPTFNAPDAPWAMTAATHQAPASVISIRAKLEPSSISRNRVRRSQRRVLSQIEEEAATGDLARAEQSETFQLAQEVEQFILDGSEPLLAECSIIMARRVGPDVPETYIDELRGVYGIEMKPLEHRQMVALDETLPCSSKRVNPFLHDISVAMLAYAGLQGFSNLGDRDGVYLGLVDPDYVPVYLSPLGAPAANLPPSMLIAGEPGSGKTFACQMISLQAALAGYQSIFINPKSDDTLEGLTDLVDGTVVRLSEIEAEGGFFDPFRFCQETDAGRQIAADILSQHVLAVLGSRGVAGQGFTQEQEIAVIAGLREGASRGARCAAEAINCIADESARKLIIDQASDPLFRLGIGLTPVETFSNNRRLLLIEFDKPLDIPEKGISPAEYTRTQRLAIAAVRLVTRASMEILANASGGVIVVDEAWMYLQSSEGLAAVQSFGRLGRSKNILPIFATQRIDDLLKAGVDMEGYLSRVLVLKLSEEREAAAALKLCGLEATPGRIDWLRKAGARYDDDGNLLRGAMGLHRDLQNRHSAVLIGPVPETARLAFSTNPEDRRRRASMKAVQNAAELAAGLAVGQEDAPPLPAPPDAPAIAPPNPAPGPASPDGGWSVVTPPS